MREASQLAYLNGFVLKDRPITADLIVITRINAVRGISAVKGRSANYCQSHFSLMISARTCSATARILSRERAIQKILCTTSNH